MNIHGISWIPMDMYRYQCNFAHHNLGYQPPPRGWEIDKLEEFGDGNKVFKFNQKMSLFNYEVVSLTQR